MQSSPAAENGGDGDGTKPGEIRLAGVDVGGTFTDFAGWDGRRLHTHKRLSTPDDPGRAVLEGLEALGWRPETIVHGTTVATNALLERRGARAGLLTTAGFRDVLLLARQNRPHLYRLYQPPTPPLVPAAWRWELPERLDARGRALISLDERALEPIAAEMEAAGIESLAIVFLFSYLDPTHERRAAAWLADRLPGVALTLSSDLLPEHREYERTATCVVNAYVGPPVAGYLSRLAGALGDGVLHVMQSNGGTIEATRGAREAARLTLSGPAGGVVGAFERLRMLDGAAPRLMTLDMGGTSTDVALCPERLLTSAEGRIAGLPIRLPTLDIHTIGAGGGSIVRVDAGGAMRVGPESAGASPGPACYGLGGERPTVTDAQLVLGRLRPDRFLGGSLTLHPDLARQALAPVATRLGLSVEAAALGAVAVAGVAMERALRRVSVERGYDPRRFTLVPFGGAGPLHACDLAAALGIERVMVPGEASVLSALGMLHASPTRERAAAVLRPLSSLPAGELAGRLDRLGEQARVALNGGRVRWEADVRYEGQSYELSLPLEQIENLDDDRLEEMFHAAHERRYGARYAAPVEVVTLRARASTPPLLAGEPAPLRPAAARAAIPFGHAPVWFEPDGPARTALFERALLKPGATLRGPALLLQPDTTVVVPPGWQAHADGAGWLRLTKAGEE